MSRHFDPDVGPFKDLPDAADTCYEPKILIILPAQLALEDVSKTSTVCRKLSRGRECEVKKFERDKKL